MIPSIILITILFIASPLLLTRGQETCPDNTPTLLTCSPTRSCPQDYLCLFGLCCPTCRRKAEILDYNVHGIYVPQCDQVGNYTAEQCFVFTGVCWCVTEVGQEIPNTRLKAKTPRTKSCTEEKWQFEILKKTLYASVADAQCPPFVGFGDCIAECQSDLDCRIPGTKCCSKGCGTRCVAPIVADLPLESLPPAVDQPKVPNQALPPSSLNSGIPAQQFPDTDIQKSFQSSHLLAQTSIPFVPPASVPVVTYPVPLLSASVGPSQVPSLPAATTPFVNVPAVPAGVISVIAPQISYEPPVPVAVTQVIPVIPIQPDISLPQTGPLTPPVPIAPNGRTATTELIEYYDESEQPSGGPYVFSTKPGSSQTLLVTAPLVTIQPAPPVTVLPPGPPSVSPKQATSITGGQTGAYNAITATPAMTGLVSTPSIQNQFPPLVQPSVQQFPPAPLHPNLPATAELLKYATAAKPDDEIPFAQKFGSAQPNAGVTQPPVIPGNFQEPKNKNGETIAPGPSPQNGNGNVGYNTLPSKIASLPTFTPNVATFNPTIATFPSTSKQHMNFPTIETEEIDLPPLITASQPGFAPTTESDDEIPLLPSLDTTQAKLLTTQHAIFPPSFQTPEPEKFETSSQPIQPAPSQAANGNFGYNIPQVPVSGSPSFKTSSVPNVPPNTSATPNIATFQPRNIPSLFSTARTRTGFSSPTPVYEPGHESTTESDYEYIQIDSSTSHIISGISNQPVTPGLDKLMSLEPNKAAVRSSLSPQNGNIGYVIPQVPTTRNSPVAPLTTVGEPFVWSVAQNVATFQTLPDLVNNDSTTESDSDYDSPSVSTSGLTSATTQQPVTTSNVHSTGPQNPEVIPLVPTLQNGNFGYNIPLAQTSSLPSASPSTTNAPFGTTSLPSLPTLTPNVATYVVTFSSSPRKTSVHPANNPTIETDKPTEPGLPPLITVPEQGHVQMTESEFHQGLTSFKSISTSGSVRTLGISSQQPERTSATTSPFAPALSPNSGNVGYNVPQVPNTTPSPGTISPPSNKPIPTYTEHITTNNPSFATTEAEDEFPPVLTQAPATNGPFYTSGMPFQPHIPTFSQNIATHNPTVATISLISHTTLWADPNISTVATTESAEIDLPSLITVPEPGHEPTTTESEEELPPVETASNALPTSGPFGTHVIPSKPPIATSTLNVTTFHTVPNLVPEHPSKFSPTATTPLTEIELPPLIAVPELGQASTTESEEEVPPIETASKAHPTSRPFGTHDGIPPTPLFATSTQNVATFPTTPHVVPEHPSNIPTTTTTESEEIDLPPLLTVPEQGFRSTTESEDEIPFIPSLGTSAPQSLPPILSTTSRIVATNSVTVFPPTSLNGNSVQPGATLGVSPIGTIAPPVPPTVINLSASTFVQPVAPTVTYAPSGSSSATYNTGGISVGSSESSVRTEAPVITFVPPGEPILSRTGNSGMKPGTCPSVSSLSLVMKGGDECFADPNCKDNQRCCKTPFGRKCLTPEPDVVKPGMCPKTSGGRTFTRVVRNDRCTVDNECIGNMKCCETNVGRSCLDPLSHDQNDVDELNTCNGVDEEFRMCGEACPRACDHLTEPFPTWCSRAGCSRGCFCKEGYVRVNSHEPKSACILPTQCPYVDPFIRTGQTAAPITVPSTKFLEVTTQKPLERYTVSQQAQKSNRGHRQGTAFKPPDAVELIDTGTTNGFQALAIDSGRTKDIRSGQTKGFESLAVLLTSDSEDLFTPSEPPIEKKDGECPTSELHQAVFDSMSVGQSSQCTSDSHCPGAQKCCALPPPFSAFSLRCLCPDANSIWNNCGPVEPESCHRSGSNSTTQCMPSCVCVVGFVKKSNDPHATCISLSECSSETSATTASTRPVPRASGRSKKPSPSINVLATARVTNNLDIGGVLFFEQDGGNLLVTGSLRGLKPGRHRVSVHLSSDLADNCQFIGTHFDPDQNHVPSDAIATLGHLTNMTTDQSGFTLVNSSETNVSLNGHNSIIGRSLVIHERDDNSTLAVGTGSQGNGENGRPDNGKSHPLQPVACGTVGIL